MSVCSDTEHACQRTTGLPGSPLLTCNPRTTPARTIDRAGRLAAARLVARGTSRQGRDHRFDILSLEASPDLYGPNLEVVRDFVGCLHARKQPLILARLREPARARLHLALQETGQENLSSPHLPLSERSIADVVDVARRLIRQYVSLSRAPVMASNRLPPAVQL